MTRPDPKTYIGGNDAAAIKGFDKYKTPSDVCLEKWGDKEPFEGNYRASKGLHDEAFIANWFFNQKGVDNFEGLSQRFFQDPQYPFLGGHADFDYRPAGKDGKRRLVSIKQTAVDNDWGEEGTDHVPKKVIVQEGHYLSILHKLFPQEFENTVDVVADITLPGETQPRVYQLQFRHQNLNAQRESMVDFWQDHIRAHVLPEPVNLPEMLSRYSADKDEIATATETDMDWIATYHQAHEDEKVAKQLKKEMAKLICRRMGSATTLTHGIHTVATWHEVESERFDIKGLREVMDDLPPAVRSAVQKFLVKSTTRRFLPKKLPKE